MRGGAACAARRQRPRLACLLLNSSVSLSLSLSPLPALPSQPMAEERRQRGACRGVMHAPDRRLCRRRSLARHRARCPSSRTCTAWRAEALQVNKSLRHTLEYSIVREWCGKRRKCLHPSRLPDWYGTGRREGRGTPTVARTGVNECASRPSDCLRAHAADSESASQWSRRRQPLSEIEWIF